MKRNLKPTVQDPETAQMTRSLKSVLLNPCRLSSRVSARRSAVILKRQKPTSEPERKRRLDQVSEETGGSKDGKKRE